MKKLITILFIVVISLTSFAQEFNAMSLVADQKVDVSTGESIKEINIFNISMNDKVIVHNRIKEDGECTSQIYRLKTYEESETEEEFKLVFFFKSDLHEYDIIVVDNKKGTFIIGQGFIYKTKVYTLKTYN